MSGLVLPARSSIAQTKPVAPTLESTSSQVLFDVSLAGESFAIGEPIVLKCNAANHTNTTIAPAVEDFESFIDPGVWPTISVVNGNRRVPTALAEPQKRSTDRILIEAPNIQPGGSYSARFILNELFQVRRAGNYILTVIAPFRYFDPQVYSNTVDFNEKSTISFTVVVGDDQKLIAIAEGLRDQILARPRNIEGQQFAIRSLLTMPLRCTRRIVEALLANSDLDIYARSQLEPRYALRQTQGP